MANAFWLNLSQLDSSFHFDFGSLLIGIVITCIAFWTGTLAWALIVCALNPDLRFFQAIQVHLLSVAVKYLPGLGLQQLSKAWQLHRAGNPAKRSFLAIGIEFGLLIITGMALLIQIWSSGTWILFGLKLDSGWGISIGGLLWIFCLAAPLSVVWVLREEEEMSKRRWRFLSSLWLAEFLNLIGWLILSLGLWFTIRTLYTIPFEILPYCTLVIILSLLAGLLALFAPNGYGVRELTMSVLLQSVIPVPLTIMSAILSRIVFISVDILGILPLLVHRFVQRHH